MDFLVRRTSLQRQCKFLKYLFIGQYGSQSPLRCYWLNDLWQGLYYTYFLTKKKPFQCDFFEEPGN